MCHEYKKQLNQKKAQIQQEQDHKPKEIQDLNFNIKQYDIQ